MGSQFFPGPWNPQACSDYALAQNAYNTNAGSSPSKMFNAFYLHKNGKPYGTYCALYSEHLDPSWATVGTSWKGGDKFECRRSWTWTFA